MSFYGANTTTFDFGSVVTDSAQAGISGDGGFDTGDAANVALDAAASAIPFGSLIKGFLDDLGLQQNIDLVFKYGLSSWGASTDPDRMKGFFAETVYPWVQSKLQMIQGSNMQAILNEVDARLRGNQYYYQALRDNHSKAGSTREANEWAQTELGKMANDINAKIVAQFKEHGIIIKKEQASSELRHQVIAFTNDAPFSGRDLDYINKAYFKYTVDASSVKSVSVDENGNVKSSSGFGVIGLAGLAFAAFKAFK